MLQATNGLNLDPRVKRMRTVNDEIERLRKLIAEREEAKEEEDPGIDYAAEYRKQTGKDLQTGEYVTQ